MTSYNEHLLVKFCSIGFKSRTPRISPGEHSVGASETGINLNGSLQQFLRFQLALKSGSLYFFMAEQIKFVSAQIARALAFCCSKVIAGNLSATTSQSVGNFIGNFALNRKY